MAGVAESFRESTEHSHDYSQGGSMELPEVAWGALAERRAR